MIKKLISSILKVTASEHLDVQEELNQEDGEKTISQLLHEQETEHQKNNGKEE